MEEKRKIIHRIRKAIDEMNSLDEEEREVVFGSVLLEMLDKVEIKNAVKIGMMNFTLSSFITAVSGKSAADLLMGKFIEMADKTIKLQLDRGEVGGGRENKENSD